MENIKDIRGIINKFQIENKKSDLPKLAELFINLRKKRSGYFTILVFGIWQRMVFIMNFTIIFPNITGVHRNPIPKYVNLFIKNELLEKTVKFAQYRYRKCLLLTKLGLCFIYF
ncbi:MAG: hypothetical protein RMJ34_05915 [candidate division WOR-3 bacterium]|nr:hypothetical protein [candidate division WOR-3 bacterium]